MKLSRQTHSAEPGALYTSEYGVYSLRFEGIISGFLPGIQLSEPPGNFSLLVLVAGLLSLDHIGGNKSTGAGAVSCSLTNIQVDSTVISVDHLLNQLEWLDLDLYQLQKEEQE